MAKSLVLTYILWFFGGFLGLHHVYLGRYKQAFLWWCFPGGYFGAGWIRDLWRIPEYVKDANNDPGFLASLSEKMRKLNKPPFSIVRFLGMLVVSNMFGMLVTMAAPKKDDELGPGLDLRLFTLLLSPVASAFGIWVVGNIGREQGSFKWPLIGCFTAFLPYVFGNASYSIVTLSGAIFFHWKTKTWRRTIEKPMPFWKKFFYLFICCGLYTSLWGSYIYFNLKLVTKDGDEVRFRDAAGNFIKSPAFQQFSKNVGELFSHLREEGFGPAWQRLIDSLDPLGERNALRVLDLKKGATQSEIKARYRELSKKWHPDRFKNQTEKTEAHERFVDIQQAYEKLSAIKLRRSEINKRSNMEEQSYPI